MLRFFYSHVAETEELPDSRPPNPTPHTAGESHFIVSDLTGKQDPVVNGCVGGWCPGDGSLRGSTRRCKSVQLDVTGKLRKSRVRLPNCIMSSKARRVPNQNVNMHHNRENSKYSGL